jgi:hypothetical protein
MNWLNLNIQTLDSEEFIGSEPVSRATWICLLRYCIGQENGGRIEDCHGWADRKWQQLVRVTKLEVDSVSALWRWEGADLFVWEYPTGKEVEVRSKRDGGRTGGQATSEAKTQASRKNGARGGRPKTQAETQASDMAEPNQKPNGKEGKEKGTEGEGERIDTLFLDAESRAQKLKSSKATQLQALAIYDAYPRKEAKPEALKAILKAMAAHSPDLLLERTKSFAAAIVWQERQFIPYPATWFNREQFNDDPENWKQPSHRQAGVKPRIVPDIGGRKPSSIANWDDAPPPSPEDYAEIEF